MLSERGDGDAALELLGPLETEAEDDAELALSVGVAYQNAGDPERAERWLRLTLESRPDDVEANFQLGLALLRQDDASGGIAAIEDAYRADPDREDIAVELARRYAQQDRPNDALRIYDDLLAGEPSVAVMERAGQFFVDEGYGERVLELGRAIVDEEEDSALGHYLRGEGYYAEGDFEEAARDFAQAARGREAPRAREALGRAHEQLGNADEALLAYRQALDADEGLLAPRLGKARIRLRRGEYSRARQELERARDIAPDEPAIDAGLGESYLAVGDARRAADLLGRAIRRRHAAPRTYYLFGQALSDLDRDGAASSALDNAVSQAEGDEAWLTDAYRLLGYAHRSRGDRRGALRAWCRYEDRVERRTAETRDVERLRLRLGDC